MIKVDVYDTILQIKIFKTYNDLIKALKKYYKKFNIDHETSEYCEAIIFFDDNNSNKAFLFIVEECISYNTISHEMFHLGNRILLYKGMTLKIEDDEEHAILNAFLNEKVIKYMNKKGYIIK